MKKILLLLLFPTMMVGQSVATIDSLEKVIESDVKISEKAAAYRPLLAYYDSRNPDKFKKLIDELDAYPAEQCVKCKVLANHFRGVSAINANRLDPAIAYFKNAADLAD